MAKIFFGALCPDLETAKSILAIEFEKEGHHGITGQGWMNASDCLRSKGYALPYLGVSVEDQIEFGWVRLATDKK